MKMFNFSTRNNVRDLFTIGITFSLIFSLIVGLTFSLYTAPAQADTSGNIENLHQDIAIELETKRADGERIFTTVCAGCHVNGSNIIRRGKNLQLKTLQRQKLDSIDAIQAIVTNGRGIMSAYGNKLNSDEIEAVANYVLDRAQHNWQD